MKQYNKHIFTVSGHAILAKAWGGQKTLILDAGKVLATVVAAIYAFADKHPTVWVYATGSTEGFVQ